jgi:hypothetical protein
MQKQTARERERERETEREQDDMTVSKTTHSRDGTCCCHDDPSCRVDTYNFSAALCVQWSVPQV